MRENYVYVIADNGYERWRAGVPEQWKDRIKKGKIYKGVACRDSIRIVGMHNTWHPMSAPFREISKVEVVALGGKAELLP